MDLGGFWINPRLVERVSPVTKPEGRPDPMRGFIVTFASGTEHKAIFRDAAEAATARDRLIQEIDAEATGPR